MNTNNKNKKETSDVIEELFSEMFPGVKSDAEEMQAVRDRCEKFQAKHPEIYGKK